MAPKFIFSEGSNFNDEQQANIRETADFMKPNFRIMDLNEFETMGKGNGVGIVVCDRIAVSKLIDIAQRGAFPVVYDSDLETLKNKFLDISFRFW